MQSREYLVKNLKYIKKINHYIVHENNIKEKITIDEYKNQSILIKDKNFECVHVMKKLEM